MLSIWLGLAVGCLSFVVWKLKKFFSLWNDKGVRSLSFLEVLKQNVDYVTKPIPDFLFKSYQKYGRIYGTFLGTEPTLVIGDPDLAKQVLVKDFSLFLDRFPNQKVNHPLWDKMVMNQTGEEWRVIRSKITPSFSSGKMRLMVESVSRTADNTVEVFRKAAKDNSVLDVKKNFGAFSLDIIAKLAFAVDLNSYEDTENPFVTHSMKAFGEEGGTRFLFSQLAPFVFKILRAPPIPKSCMDFFKSLTEGVIRKRKDEDKNHIDFLQLLLNARKESSEDETQADENDEQKTSKQAKEGLDMETIIAQSILFFVAAYDTTGSTLAFASYNLAQNPDVQDKLIKEIDEKIKSEDDISYDTIFSMPYLEAVIDETLRLYPVAHSLFRICTTDTTLGDIPIEKGTSILIPICAMHMDPQLFPEPTKFQPERFLPENKSSLVPFSYMPFGEGPRHCIGMRLAMMDMKVMLIKALRKFKFQKCSETVDHMEFMPLSIVLTPKHPIKLKVVERTK